MGKLEPGTLVHFRANETNDLDLGFSSAISTDGVNIFVPSSNDIGVVISLESKNLVKVLIYGKMLLFHVNNLFPIRFDP